jgi:hypothetical protein
LSFLSRSATPRRRRSVRSGSSSRRSVQRRCVRDPNWSAPKRHWTARLAGVLALRPLQEWCLATFIHAVTIAINRNDRDMALTTSPGATHDLLGAEGQRCACRGGSLSMPCRRA